MLLLSPGDDSASLPLDSLQHPPDAMSACQSSMDCDPADIGLPSTPVSKTVEGDRDEGSVRTQTAFDATCVGDRALLAPSFATPSTRPNAFLSDPSLPEAELDGLYALRQAAKLTTQQRINERERSLRIALATLPEIANAETVDVLSSNSYAAPLAPLRERDIIALSALFARDDISAIDADVKYRLLTLFPEPCWDDDVFAFLHEFL